MPDEITAQDAEDLIAAIAANTQPVELDYVPAPKASLYMIEKTLQDLEIAHSEAFDEGNAEALAVIDDEIAKYLTKETEKIDGYSALIRLHEHYTAGIDAEIDRLKALKKEEIQRIDTLKTNAIAAMTAYGIKELRTATHSLTIRGNGGPKPLKMPEDINDLPTDCKKVEIKMPLSVWRLINLRLGKSFEFFPEIHITVLADNTYIRSVLERKEPIPGCELLDRGKQLKVT
jgi:hypothetical protein